MDELGEKIQEIFNDPEKMQQVMHLAASLGAEPPDDSAGLSGARRSSRQAALVQALLPYLRPGRRERLQRAIQVAQLSNLGSLLQQAGLTAQPKEDDHV